MWRIEFRGWFHIKKKELVQAVRNYNVCHFALKAGVGLFDLHKSREKAKAACNALADCEGAKGAFPVFVPRRVK